MSISQRKDAKALFALTLMKEIATNAQTQVL
jgi:hypothetical protein